ncbi:MFS transporter [Canibacter zhoujuaniae]|uniref:MFS transporter n=1 Tax=Canibacter zhoujuaniae TaxID=2708343 RepID=UPI001420ED9E|nr:MFS transporter [Canibacter zhoujuaniae]
MNNRKTVLLAIIALAIGSFGIGAAEFLPMGILPEIASDLLETQYITNRDLALGNSSWFISAYAMGVIIGAPVVTILAGRFNPKRVLLIFMASFVLTTLATVLTNNFALAVVMRFIAGLPHGSYFGLAPLVAARMMGPGQRGRAVSYVMLGLPLASLAGVPVLTLVGQTFGWRIALGVIAGVFLLAVIAIAVTVPAQETPAHAPLTSQFRVLTKPLLWLAFIAAMLGTAGFFAVYSYISPLVTDVAQLDAHLVSATLVLVGLGQTLGSLTGGRLADINKRFWMRIALLAFLTGCAIVAFGAHNPLILGAGVFVMAFSSGACSPMVAVWMMDITPESPVIGSSLMHSAFNAANALGAAGGGLMVGLGFGFNSPAFLAIGFTALGLLALLLAQRVQRHLGVATAPIQTLNQS